MALPQRDVSQEERIKRRHLAAMATPDGALLLETARLLMKVADRLERTDEALSLEVSRQRLKIEQHLGLVWDWREDIGVPRPDGSE